MQHIYRRIQADPRFQELERKRSRFIWMLVAILAVNEIWYIGATAFFPKYTFAALWGQPVAEGHAMTWGIIIGATQTVLYISC